ncbi:MAG: hypothetical protein IKL40_01675 [Clostridia bacterium]|nr:hypothetical protein [Clostridia bacterium]
MKILKLIDYITALTKEGLLINHSVSNENLDKDILCLTYDTRELSDSALFIVKGAHFREEYLDQAMSKHALAFVRRRNMQEKTESQFQT